MKSAANIEGIINFIKKHNEIMDNSDFNNFMQHNSMTALLMENEYNEKILNVFSDLIVNIFNKKYFYYLNVFIKDKIDTDVNIFQIIKNDNLVDIKEKVKKLSKEEPFFEWFYNEGLDYIDQIRNNISVNNLKNLFSLMTATKYQLFFLEDVEEDNDEEILIWLYELPVQYFDRLKDKGLLNIVDHEELTLSNLMTDVRFPMYKDLYDINVNIVNFMDFSNSHKKIINNLQRNSSIMIRHKNGERRIEYEPQIDRKGHKCCSI